MALLTWSWLACALGIFLSLLGLLLQYWLEHRPVPEPIMWPDTWEQIQQKERFGDSSSYRHT